MADTAGRGVLVIAFDMDESNPAHEHLFRDLLRALDAKAPELGHPVIHGAIREDAAKVEALFAPAPVPVAAPDEEGRGDE